VGLVARVLEARGLATVCLSMIPEWTAAVGAPRVAGLDYPFGRPLGQPGDAPGQRAVLAAALEVLATATTPGTVARLPFVWPEPPDAARDELPAPPPIVALIKHKPWLYLKLLAGDIPEPALPGR
jgi:hypothetical protein